MYMNSAFGLSEFLLNSVITTRFDYDRNDWSVRFRFHKINANIYLSFKLASKIIRGFSIQIIVFASNIWSRSQEKQKKKKKNFLFSFAKSEKAFSGRCYNPLFQYKFSKPLLSGGPSLIIIYDGFHRRASSFRLKILKFEVKA